ncbi:MAG: hypothetical protein V7637_4912 [Mycobacteriales bacterium]|jgi:2-keto-4-pentenoate hydratase
MSRDDIAAELLWLLHRGKPAGVASPALTAYQDANLVDGERLQLAVLDHWLRAGEQVGGWKIGWTSRGARASRPDDFRPFGYVLASRVLPSGTKIEPASIPQCRLEPEICVRLGTDLAGADVTVGRARAAVVAVAPAFEVCARRLPPGMPPAIRLGNAMNNWGIVVGPEQAPGEVELGALTVRLSRDGEVIDSGTSAPDTLDDPYLSLSRVCRSLAAHGLGLRAGQHLITGSITNSTPVDPGHLFEATFGPLGTVAAYAI